MTNEDKINTALEDFQFLEEQDKENSMVNEQILYRTAHKSLMFQIDLINKSTRNDSNATNFKSSVNVLMQFYKAAKGVLNESINNEKKAFYWKMKYDGVIEQEKINQNLLDSIAILMDENDRLQQTKK